MKYYPIFLKLAGEKVVFSGAGDHAAAKIKLLLKTQAFIFVIGKEPCSDVQHWAEQNKIHLIQREITIEDVANTRLVYGANDDPDADARAVALGKQAGALTNIVDNLEASEFLTPAMVDRDPVIVAIGTEGTAPVLARKIKSDIEEMLPLTTGVLASIANAFRPMAARLKTSTDRRSFWQKFFFTIGPRAITQGGTAEVETALLELFNDTKSKAARHGHADLIGTGPGDPELLTLKARRKLHEADVILHDRLVTPEILELARREATVICVGKKGYGPSWKQEDINALLVEHVAQGHKVARLKSGDATIYGRLDEEIDALDAAGLSWDVVPGITSASAAAATMGTSLTRRGRNSSLRYLTGRDVDGFAEHEWKALAQDGSTAAIYMGLKAVRFLSGRLLMHGASPQTPLTIVENVSRINQRVISSSLGAVTQDIEAADISGPAILFLGLSPRKLNQVSFNTPEMTALTAKEA